MGNLINTCIGVELERRALGPGDVAKVTHDEAVQHAMRALTLNIKDFADIPGVDGAAMPAGTGA